MTTILGASASGMMASQRMVDHIGNNISNFQTITYKHARPMAEGRPNDGAVPEAARLGVAVTETDRIMAFGSPVATGDPLNFAIMDDAFYRVTTAGGATAYTRNGTLSVDHLGQVSHLGLQLDPPMAAPPGSRYVEIGADGTITARDLDGNLLEVGRIELYRFGNPKGLRDIGGGLYTESANSGAIVGGVAGEGDFEGLLTGHLEGSNVDVADEMAQMMIAQRLYTANAKAFGIGDDMLRIATQLTR